MKSQLMRNRSLTEWLGNLMRIRNCSEIWKYSLKVKSDEAIVFTFGRMSVLALKFADGRRGRLFHCLSVHTPDEHFVFHKIIYSHSAKAINMVGNDGSWLKRNATIYGNPSRREENDLNKNELTLLVTVAVFVFVGGRQRNPNVQYTWISFIRVIKWFKCSKKFNISS